MLDTIQLPDDSVWTDEFAYTPTDHAIQFTLGGKQIIQDARRMVGRPITLDAQWIDRAAVDALFALLDVPDGRFPLDLNGRLFTVVFRHGDGDPLSVEPVIEYPSYQTDDRYAATIKLIET